WPLTRPIRAAAIFGPRPNTWRCAAAPRLRWRTPWRREMSHERAAFRSRTPRARVARGAAGHRCGVHHRNLGGGSVVLADQALCAAVSGSRRADAGDGPVLAVAVAVGNAGHYRRGLCVGHARRLYPRRAVRPVALGRIFALSLCGDPAG